MTISGVKNLLNLNTNYLDDDKSNSLKADYYKKVLRDKSINLLEKIRKIKGYGKKTHLKVQIVPESNLIVNLYIMQKNLQGEKAKDS